MSTSIDLRRHALPPGGLRAADLRVNDGWNEGVTIRCDPVTIPS